MACIGFPKPIACRSAFVAPVPLLGMKSVFSEFLVHGVMDYDRQPPISKRTLPPALTLFLNKTFRRVLVFYADLSQTRQIDGM